MAKKQNKKNRNSLELSPKLSIQTNITEPKCLGNDPIDMKKDSSYQLYFNSNDNNSFFQGFSKKKPLKQMNLSQGN